MSLADSTELARRIVEFAAQGLVSQLLDQCLLPLNTRLHKAKMSSDGDFEIQLAVGHELFYLTAPTPRKNHWTFSFWNRGTGRASTPERAAWRARHAFDGSSLEWPAGFPEQEPRLPS